MPKHVITNNEIMRSSSFDIKTAIVHAYMYLYMYSLCTLHVGQQINVLIAPAYPSPYMVMVCILSCMRGKACMYM